MNRALATLSAVALAGTSIHGCELCAIYGATAARNEVRGPVLTIAEQYISEHTLQYNSKEIAVPVPEYLDDSITHIIPGYNFSRDLGINLNIPIVHRDFRYYDFNTGNPGGRPPPYRRVHKKRPKRHRRRFFHAPAQADSGGARTA